MAYKLFEDFPLLAYTLNDYSSEQVVTDIFRRIILSKEFSQNSAFFEDYEVLHGETPEEISYRFYGTTELHWLVLMVNDIIDPRFEWPTSQENLLLDVETKYGGQDSIFTNKNALDKKGYRVETFFLLTEDSTHKNPKRLVSETDSENFTKQPIAYANSSSIFSFETHYDIEEKRNETNRNIRIIKAEIVDEIVTNYKNLIKV